MSSQWAMWVWIIRWTRKSDDGVSNIHLVKPGNAALNLSFFEVCREWLCLIFWCTSVKKIFLPMMPKYDCNQTRSLIFSPGCCLSLRLRMHFFLTFPSYTGRFFCSVVECAKPSIPRHLLVSIVAFIITVVQLVIKGAECQSSFILDQKILIPSMCHRSTGSLINNMEN